MNSDILGTFSFLSDAGNPDVKIMLGAFVVFIIVAYKALNVLKNTVIVSVIAGCFPFVLSRVFGFEVDVTLELILFYVISGVILYLAYELVKVFCKTSKLFLGIAGMLMYPFVLLSKMLPRAFKSKYIVMLLLIAALAAAGFYFGSQLKQPQESDVLEDKVTVRGVFTLTNGCMGVVAGTLLTDFADNCDESAKYEGNFVEVTGFVYEHECDPEEQCFDGQYMKNIESIRIVDAHTEPLENSWDE